MRTRISTRVYMREQCLARARVSRGWKRASGVRSSQSCPKRLMFLLRAPMTLGLALDTAIPRTRGLLFKEMVQVGQDVWKSRIVHRFYVMSYSNGKDNPATAECINAWERLTPGITMVVCYSIVHASTAKKPAVYNAVIEIKRDGTSNRPSLRRRRTRCLRHLLRRGELLAQHPLSSSLLQM